MRNVKAEVLITAVIITFLVIVITFTLSEYSDWGRGNKGDGVCIIEGPRLPDGSPRCPGWTPPSFLTVSPPSWWTPAPGWRTPTPVQ